MTNSFSSNAYPTNVENLGTTSITSTAVRLGMVLNRLRYLIEVAWITHQISDADSISCLWSELKILAREFFVTEIYHPQIQCHIDAIEQDWNRDFDSDWHRDLLSFENSKLLAVQEQGLDLPDGETTQDLFFRVASIGSKSIRQLTSDFRGALSETQRCHFDLGMHHDQFEHPHMTRKSIEFKMEQNLPLDLEIICWETIVERSSYLLPIEPPIPLSDWPDEDWYIQYHHILCKSESIAGDVGELPMDLVSTQTKLGLVLDPVENKVTRHGYENPIFLQKRIFKLLTLLHEDPGKTVEWLMENWGQVGRAATSKRSTVDDALADLSNNLIDLKLDVIIDADGGRHIREHKQKLCLSRG